MANREDENALNTISANFENLVEEIAVNAINGKEWAKHLVYTHYKDNEIFKGCLAQLASHDESRAKDIIYGENFHFFKEYITEWAMESNKKAVEFICERPTYFKEIIKNWAEDLQNISFTWAKRYILENPLVNDGFFKFTIVDWAIEGNELARNVVCKSGSRYDGFRLRLYSLTDSEDATTALRAQDFIIDNFGCFRNQIKLNQIKLNKSISSRIEERLSAGIDDKKVKQAIVLINSELPVFKDFIINSAQEKVVFAFDCVIDNYEIFEDYEQVQRIISDWANGAADEKAAEARAFIYKNPGRFTGTIIDWANGAADEKAVEARAFIYKNPGCFKETISDWANGPIGEKAVEARAVIYKNPKWFKEIISDWSIGDWANDATDERAVEARSVIRKNPYYFKECFVCWAHGSDGNANKMIYREMYRRAIGGNVNSIKLFLEESDFYASDEIKELLYDWVVHGNEAAKDELVDEYFDFMINRWMLDTFNDTSSHRNIVSFFKRDKEKSLKFILAVILNKGFDAIAELINGGNKESVEIMKRLVFSDEFKTYLEEYNDKNEDIVKDFVTDSYWCFLQDIENYDVRSTVVFLALRGCEIAKDVILSNYGYFKGDCDYDLRSELEFTESQNLIFSDFNN